MSLRHLFLPPHCSLQATEVSAGTARALFGTRDQLCALAKGLHAQLASVTAAHSEGAASADGESTHGDVADGEFDAALGALIPNVDAGVKDKVGCVWLCVRLCVRLCLRLCVRLCFRLCVRQCAAANGSAALRSFV